jgi:DNA topoisomerase-1
MLLRKGRRGRSYLACSAYPKCSNIMGLDRAGNPVEMAQGKPTGLKCPKCGGRTYLHEDDGGVFKCSRCSTAQPVLTLEDALQQTEELNADAVDPCEDCGSPMAVKRGKKGLFLGCSRYPECTGTRKLNRDELPAPVPTQEVCEKCGRPMLLRWGRFGRFLACSGFPRCRNTRQLSSSMPPCPQPDCTGRLTRKVSADGEEFCGCTRFPDCDYTCQELPKKKRSSGGGGSSAQ